jgi:membrane-bound lytic murein transglycosylase B
LRINRTYILILLSSLFLLLLVLAPKSHAGESFEEWKIKYAKKASKRGLPYQFVIDTLRDVKFDPEVVKKDKNQITSSKKADYLKFMKRWLRDSPSRVDRGILELEKHRVLLEKIEKRYGVEKEIIVSLWGVETLYGDIVGDYNIVRSLSSLAFDGRRRKFFETQLNATLRIIRKGHVSAEDFVGSWAGATGQCQFMPSNINVYAQDFDGDGKKDIWNNKADLFASIANFLRKAGWKKNKSIGSLATNSSKYKGSLNSYRSSKSYRKLGFTDVDGSHLKSRKWLKRKASRISMQNSPIVLRGSNYKVLKRWNRSSLFTAFNIILMDAFKQNEAIN